MNNVKQAFKTLQDSGNFEPFQLHVVSDRIWITPYVDVINYKQLQAAMAAAELFHLLPTLFMYKDSETCRLDLINY